METNVSEDVKPNEGTQETAVSRREFGAVSLSAGLAAVTGAPAANAAERPLTETDVIMVFETGEQGRSRSVRRYCGPAHESFRAGIGPRSGLAHSAS
jgi:hypothetical protein